MQLKSRPTALLRQPLSTVPRVSPEAAIKPMIMRLEAALGRRDLAKDIVLLLRPKPPTLDPRVEEQTINFVVGYSGSAHSQAALDLALCAAHQTRLARPNPVVVHVVYVVDKTRPKTIANADRILWQARCLASEWRGSLNAHLRVGQVATELSQVAREIGAEVLLVGCHTAKHQLVRQLDTQTPCSVLGLPK
ncbi:universal stress protein [Nodosilinea sp. PGN35]|uniref:universal stress protein n=1 Tax=Nodosilinea sp. PGN35 TaxID=3020489 RepID=UPI0023B2C7D9|nr:universal stress protein [Nodosilinea sp. TSF1-S3]MDF0369312.1 universal stress protein [Nodosilinea sp. TSF1-S3]